jgi:hypothetical protein
MLVLDIIYTDCTLNSPDTLADSVVALSIAASTDEVNKRLVVTDDDQLKIFLILTALSEIATISKPSLISDFVAIPIFQEAILIKFFRNTMLLRACTMPSPTYIIVSSPPPITQYATLVALSPNHPTFSV